MALKLVFVILKAMINRKAILFLLIFYFIFFSFVNNIRADGADDSYSGGCQDEQNLDKKCAFQRIITVDLSDFQNQFVIIQSHNPRFCGDATSSVLNSKFDWPTIDDTTGYRVLKKEYFLQKGGIEGLFSKKTTVYEANNFYDCTGSYIVMTPKDQANLDKNTLTLWVPGTDSEYIKDSYNPYDTNDYAGKKYIPLPPREAYLQQTGNPTPFTSKTYFYRPAGFYCNTSSSSSCNNLVLYRYKEVWKLDDGTSEEHTVLTPKFADLIAIASNSNTAVTSAPTTTPSTLISTSTPEVTKPKQNLESPLPIAQPSKLPWWTSIYCFFLNLFGGRC